MNMYTYIIKFLASFILTAIMVSACTSREEKVAETIKNEMFKNLYDFESYQPIETKIDTLKRDKYGDTLIFDNVLEIAVANEAFKKAESNFNEQHDIAEIYVPSYYSSSSSDNKFYEARNNMKKALDEMEFYINIMDSLRIDIKSKEKKCDNSQYGWFVTHKFRCKTKGGNSTIGTYYYFMDNDCERIIRTFDEDDLALEQYHHWIDESLDVSADKETNEKKESKEK